MKNLFLAILLLPLLSFSARSFATGCLWFEEYIYGEVLGNELKTGEIRCRRAYKDQYSCEFLPEDSPSFAIHSVGFFTEYEVPAQGQVSVRVKRTEAMLWENCDGSDPAPPFKANGILHSLFYGNKEFRRFERTK